MAKIKEQHHADNSFPAANKHVGVKIASGVKQTSLLQTATQITMVNEKLGFVEIRLQGRYDAVQSPHSPAQRARSAESLRSTSGCF